MAVQYFQARRINQCNIVTRQTIQNIRTYYYKCESNFPK